MVAIVSGNSLGLTLGSMAALGARGAMGNAGSGRNGELAFVNAATGNLVLRDQDDVLVTHGLDATAVRTYNSLGKLNDDNGDNWSTGLYAQQLRLVGTRNTVGSTIIRTDRDGAEATYTYDVARSLYSSSAGGGAYDSIAYDGVTSQYVWSDGDSGTQERYDSAATGRLLSTKDTLGNTLTYTYNAAGLIASVGDSSGETTFYDYSGANLTQLRTVFLSAGVSQTLTRVHYTYDTSNRLSTVSVDLTPADNSIADGKVYTTTYTYDGTSRRVASASQSDGTSLSFTYVVVGTDYRVATVRDALNNLTTFTYDTVARRTTVTDPLGFNTLLDYDALGQLVRVTAPPIGGDSATYVYTPTGDLSRVIDGEGRTVDMTYDANGNQTSQRDAAGNTVTRTFDAHNQLLTETAYATPDPDGAGPGQPGAAQTTRYVYDAPGKNLLRFTLSAEGRVTQYIYNAYGEQTSSIAYGAAGYDTSALGVTGVPTEAQMTTWVGTQDRTKTVRTDMAYDTRGQVLKTTAYGNVDAAGNGVADASRSITQYVYDQAGLLLKTVSGLNGTTVYTYDGLGRRLSATDATNQLTLTQYDDANAKTLLTLASGLATTSAFDRAGRLVSVTQSSASVANLGQTQYFYDADSRLLMTQDPTGVRQWMVYDDDGRKVADVDATGRLTEYAYDRSDRLTSTIVHATVVNTGALVDAGGNPVNVSLASIRPATNVNDQKSWRAYDIAGRLSKTVDAGGSVVELGYDGASRVVKTTAYATTIATASLGSAPTAVSIAPLANAADRVTRSFYDNDGRLVGTLDAEGYLSENQYDAAGRLLIAMRYAAAAPTAMQAAGTLAQLRPAAAAADQRQTFLYNAKGQVAGWVDAENYLTEKVYDADGNLSKVIQYATQLAAAVAPTASLASIRPAANAEDHVTTWVYDVLDRVTQQTNAEGTQSRFAYDSVGNLVSTTQAYGQPEVRTLNARFDIQGRLIGELTGEGGAQLTGALTQAQIDAVWAQYGVSYTYDAAGRRLSSTDQNGNETVFYYDQDGRVTQSINALGEVEEQQYNTLGQLSATVRYGTRISLAGLTGGLVTTALTSTLNAIRNAALDSKQSFTYFVTGTLATSTDALNNVTTNVYDAFEELTSQTSPLGGGTTRTDTESYDRRGLVVGAAADTSGINATTSSTYDAFGRLTRSIDANGNVSQQSFDRDGRIVQTIDAGNSQRSTTYDAFDRVLTQTDANLQVTRYAYSKSARSVVVTTPEGISVTTVHTRHGQTQTIKDGKGQTTSFAYDRDGNLLTTTTLLTTTRQSYDKADRLIETIDPRGIKVDFTYDAADRVLTRRQDPTGLNLTTTYAYDAKGQQVSVTDPLGTVTTTSYDLKGQTFKQVVDAAGLNLQTSWTWDARGKNLTVTDPSGAVVQYTYDKLGRRTKEQVDPTGLNITRSWTYDKNGNAVTATDGNGNVSRFAYDGLDRLVYSVDAAGDASRTDYDAEGRVVRTTRFAKPVALISLPTPATIGQIQPLIVTTPGKDAIEARRYDRDGRLRFIVDGNGAVTEMKYDANGNVVESIGYINAIDLTTWDGTTDPVVTADLARDRHIRTVYDQLNRATYVADGMGAVTANVYDLNGNVTKRVQYANTVASTATPNSVVASSNDRVNVYIYDAANRETWCEDPFGAVTRFDYDAGGNALKTTKFANLIGAGGTPSAVTANAADRVTTRVFDKAGRMTYVADAMGYVTRNSYDGNGRVTATTQFGQMLAAGAAPTAVAANAAIDRTHTFVYDLAGRLNTSTDAIFGKQAFTYDGLGNKLTFTNEKSSVWTYAYDAAGRLLTETTPQVELTATAVAPVTSNLVEGATVTAAIVTQLGYDGLGNLTSRTEAQGRPEQRTTRYDYDAAGRQIKVTYPPVGVYSETTAALTINSGTRSDTTQTLSTFTYYDALGDAVANVDVAGSTSLKAYDAMGRVKYEVDALGFVTGYVRNAFGEATSVIRYASGTTLSNATPTSAAQAPTAAWIATTLAAAGVDHTADRVLITAYDKLGRAATVTEPTAFIFDSTGETATGGGTTTAGAAKQTVNTFDAFGDLIRVAQSKTSSSWIYTYSYYDKVGNQIGMVDPMGFLTTKSFDAVGNLTKTIEYAAALTSGNWTATTFNAPAVTPRVDRVTEDSYDLANRKMSETRRQVENGMNADGTSNWSDLTTTYGYDAVGNLLHTTDALGATTYSYYDALGRVTAVVAPSRSTIDGTNLIPLTTFRRDAYGNVVVKVDHAVSAVSASDFVGNSSTATPGYVAGANSSADRATVSTFDLDGHATETTDANATSAFGNTNHFFSYNARGQLAKSWQGVIDNGTTISSSSLFEAYQYDKLGRLTDSYDPGPTASPSLNDTGLYYDAFGDVINKGVNGGKQEYFDYDNDGRLWRTNTGDGVDRVFLYDLLGRQTSQISSSGNGFDGRDLHLLTSADQAASLNTLRRTDSVYDALGRVTSQIEPQRSDAQAGIRVVRQLDTDSIASSATIVGQDESTNLWAGTNRVDLSWSSLANLGAGDVRVELYYNTAAVQITPPVYDEGVLIAPATYTPIVAGSRTMATTADAAASGVSFTWAQADGDTTGGVGAVTRFVVYKKDAQGNWVKLIDRPASGYAGNTIEVAAPADPSTSVVLQMRPTGTTAAWVTYAMSSFGSALRYDANGLPIGNYDYRVQTTVLGQPTRTSSMGTLTLTDVPLATIGVALNYASATSGLVTWQAQPSNIVQAFRYRVAGSGSAWSTLAVAARGTGLQGVDTTALAAGTFEFELQWTHLGDTSPYAHALGNFTVTAAVAPVVVPPVGFPNVTGVTVGSRTVAGVNVAGLYWNVPSTATQAPVLQYRLAGTTTWSTLATTAASGVGSASLDASAFAAGSSYEFNLSYSDSTGVIALATGTIAVNAAGVTGPLIIRYDGSGDPIYGDIVHPAPPDPTPYILGYENYSRMTYFQDSDYFGNPLTGSNPDLINAGNGDGGVIDGGDGPDMLEAFYDNFTIHGGAGDDIISSGGGARGVWVYDGGPGDDQINGMGGYGSTNYALFGRGDGHDFVEAGFVGDSAVTDILKFKDGVRPQDIQVGLVNSQNRGPNGAIRFTIVDTGDSIVFDGFHPSNPSVMANMVHQVQFADGTVWHFADIVAHITSQANAQTLGGSGNDVMTGTTGNDYLVGNAGDDTLDGGAGDDFLDGGAGNNTYLFGHGDGHDTIMYQAFPSPTRSNTLRMKAGVAPSDVALREVPTSGTWFSSDLQIKLKSTGDTLTVSGYFAPIYTTDARDWIPVQQIVFADGTVWNTAQIDAMVFAGTAGDDRLIANTPSTLNGGDGNDLLVGSLVSGGGADTLIGGAGDDQIYGGLGDNYIIGGPGRDRLVGGYGNTTYEFGRGDGQDLILPSINQGVPGTNNVLLLRDIASTDVRLRGLTSYGASQYELSVNGTTDLVYLTTYVVNSIQFSDGVVWDATAMKANLDTSSRPLYGSPVVTGADIVGRQILAPGYYWQDNVLVALPYSERGIVGYNGQPVYGTLTVTTPPYTPGYTIPGSPKQYSLALNTPANSSAVSGPPSLNAVLALSSTSNGDNVNLRPVVKQTYDRWGNVLTVTDARNAAWVTSYTYNANNEVTQVTQPSTGTGVPTPITKTYYDVLGRQIDVKDANGHVNGKSYDMAGNLVAEMHADGGVVTYAYDAFGDKVSMTDALGNAATGTNAAATKLNHTTTYQYDKLDELIITKQGQVNVWSMSTGMTLTGGALQNLTETYVYDAAGRKIRETDGGGRVIDYRYDRAGNIIETRKSSTNIVKSSFDALGRKTSDTDQNSAITSYVYDYFGRLQTKTDIGGATTTYSYDKAGQILNAVNNRAGALQQNLAYTYDAAGQVKTITDASLGEVTSYAYDFAGNHVLERTVQGTVTYQDNHLAYDALGRLRDVSDEHVHMSIDYDLVGNRTHIGTSVNIGALGSVSGTGSTTPLGDNIQPAQRYFRYDAMNRQITVDGLNTSGAIGQVLVNGKYQSQGHTITYDVNGNRTSDTYYGNRVITTNNAATIIGYDEDGNAIYSDPSVTFQTTPGYTIEGYAYDALDRLTSVVRDGVQVDLRFYDGSGDVVQTGPTNNLPINYATELNKGVPQDSTIGVEQRRNLYDAVGRLVEERVYKSDGTTLKYDILYNLAGSYDAAGNLQKYQLKNYDGGNYSNTYTYQTLRQNTYLNTRIDGVNNDSPKVFNAGNTVNVYDGNGYLVSVTDGTRASNGRTFVNDVSGQALQVTQNGNVEHQLVVNGQVLGQYGSVVDPVNPRATSGDNAGEQQFTSQANFNFGYQPINGNYPTASAGTYIVQAGDTLQSVAQGAYGDSQLWYSIAEANGLSGNSDLRVGQTLTIPNRVGTVHDNSQTVKPYDPSKITGDTTPNMPVPAAHSGCGGLGLILVVVVAIVVTIYTAGAAAELFNAVVPAIEGGSLSTFGAGLTVLSGGAVGGGSIAAGAGFAAAGAAAIGGAVGSIVSQGVGIAAGVQSSFSWKQVALSALASGATSGVGQVGQAFPSLGLAGQGLGATVGKAAIANALTQGLGVATGLQSSFNWKGVAASAAGAAVGWKASELLDSNGAFANLKGLTGIARGTVSGFAAGLTTAALKGGRVAVSQIAEDAFGNALGLSVAQNLLASDQAANLAASEKAGFESAAAVANSDAQLQAFRRYEITQENFDATRPDYASQDDADLGKNTFRMKDGRIVHGSVTVRDLPIDVLQNAGTPARPDGYENSAGAWIPVDNTASIAPTGPIISTQYPLTDLAPGYQSRFGPILAAYDMVGQGYLNVPTDAEGTMRILSPPAGYEVPSRSSLEWENIKPGLIEGFRQLPAAAWQLAQAAGDVAGLVDGSTLAYGLRSQLGQDLVAGRVNGSDLLLNVIHATPAGIMMDIGEASPVSLRRAGANVATNSAILGVTAAAGPIARSLAAGGRSSATLLDRSALAAGPAAIGSPLKTLVPEFVPGFSEADVLSIPKGARPNPWTYLTQSYRDAHAELFQGGAVRIQPTAPTGTIGRTETWVLPKSIADGAIANAGGDVRTLENVLGLDSGYLGNAPVRVDIPDPSGYRIPTGNEFAASDRFWRPGGSTWPGGLPEAVINPVRPGGYIVSPIFGL